MEIHHRVRKRKRRERFLWVERERECVCVIEKWTFESVATLTNSEYLSPQTRSIMTTTF
jgi:hypothetical protein